MLTLLYTHAGRVYGQPRQHTSVPAPTISAPRAQMPIRRTVEPLAFLLGRWYGTEPVHGLRYVEEWTWEGDSLLSGAQYWLRERTGDTLRQELRLIGIDSLGLWLLQPVEGSEYQLQRFRCVATGPNRAQFEAPRGSFPNTLIYEHTMHHTLRVTRKGRDRHGLITQEQQLEGSR